MHLNAEALVNIAAHGDIGAEKHFEIDVWFLRNSLQQRRLVLDGMGHKVGEAELASFRE